ncbi:hypothetical protein QBC44DRAFT_316022 [Cladorrhinum sp. PSN332]|nr:hypothetical protein QBC44DRAFT_316022 [Cladorrhinum sp. PSN332]
MAPPTVATEPTTPGALLLSLAITNGRPFKDHWAFFVGRTINSPVGILLHATGDVRSGFTFQIKRNLDWTRTSSRAQLVDLHWVAPAHFNEAMWNNGEYLTETPGVPVCAFEESAASAPVPDRSLRAADDLAAPRTGRVIQRNCQTWIVEASEKLVEDGMIPEAVLEYLRDIKQ